MSAAARDGMSVPPRDETEENRVLAAVPCLAAVVDIVLRLLPFETAAAFNVLDLGGGSGLLAAAILGRFREAHVTVMEEAEGLRGAAERRLGDVPGRYQIVPQAFEQVELPRGFDAVVSLLRFHHVEEIARRAVYREVYGALLPNSLFLVADKVRAPSPAVAALHLRASPPAPDVPAERGLLLSHELPWLVNIGLRDVDIHYKNIDYAVYGGRRPRASDFKFGELKDDEPPRARAPRDKG